MSDNRLVSLYQELEHVFAEAVIEFPHADGLYDSDFAAVLTHRSCFIFKGVFASSKIDNLPVEAPSACVFNTDLCTSPGTQWVTVYITESDTTTYFDSNSGLPH